MSEKLDILSNLSNKCCCGGPARASQCFKWAENSQLVPCVTVFLAICASCPVYVGEVDENNERIMCSLTVTSAVSSSAGLIKPKAKKKIDPHRAAPESLDCFIKTTWHEQ